MSEKSQRALSAALIELPEIDDSGSVDLIEKRIYNAVLTSSAIELLENFGNSSFKYSWLVLGRDIKNSPFDVQVSFIQELINKMEEKYDFTFPQKVSLYTEFEVNQFYKFIEFLEYDNVDFLVQVWKYLGPKNLVKLDIENFCKTHEMKIIKEIENQSDTYFESSLITILLRTYYKKGMIDWFVKHSKRLNVEITVLMEQEKTN